MKTHFRRESYSKRERKNQSKAKQKDNKVATKIVPQIQKTYLKVAGQLLAYITLGTLVFSTVK